MSDRITNVTLLPKSDRLSVEWEREDTEFLGAPPEYRHVSRLTAVLLVDGQRIGRTVIMSARPRDVDAFLAGKTLAEIGADWIVP